MKVGEWILSPACHCPPGPTRAAFRKWTPPPAFPFRLSSPGTNSDSAARGPGDVLDEPRELAAQGNDETALGRYLSYYDQTRTSAIHPPLVSALDGWVALGQKYPKARQALVGIRQRDLRAFSQGQGNVELFSELAQVNKAMQEEETTYVLFKALARADPPLANQ